MGLLDNVIGALGSQAPGGGGQGDLLNVIIGLLGQQGGGANAGFGGLGGLLQKFEQAGLGEVAKSWVGTGANQPVTPDQLGGVLGNDAIAGIARQLGVNPQDALGQLSQMLPQVVDKLTPQGQVPPGDVGGLGDLGSLLGGLGGLLGPR